jgi:hypothetical protein
MLIIHKMLIWQSWYWQWRSVGSSRWNRPSLFSRGRSSRIVAPEQTSQTSAREVLIPGRGSERWAKYLAVAERLATVTVVARFRATKLPAPVGWDCGGHCGRLPSQW